MHLFTFDKPQKVCTVGSVRIGGQPGENPPVLIGSMFHKGDRLISDRKKAQFDAARAREYLAAQQKLSEETGIPAMIDIVGNSTDEFKAYIDFIAANTGVPFAVDAWKREPKIGAAKYAVEQGLTDRLLYNSLSPWSDNLAEEVDQLSEIGVKHVVLAVFDDQDQKSEGRLKSLETLGKVVLEVPFGTILVDTTTMNLPALAFSFAAGYKIKESWGLPVGCSPANGSYAWKRARELWGPEGFASIDSAANAAAALLWNDFLIYGPIVGAPRIFPAVAVAASMTSTFVFDETGRLPDRTGVPLDKLFSEFADQLKTASDAD